MTTNDSLYVVVGGQGGVNNNSKTSGAQGGYNGGGSTGWHNDPQYGEMWTAGGGGATHIATESGILKDLFNYKDTAGSNKSNEILLVAGGGGGGSYHNNTSLHSHGDGGCGGGYMGCDGMSYGSYPVGGGATTTNAGSSTANIGGFGYGGYSAGGASSGTSYSSGGGAGWYGGGCGLYSGSGGGSGYINSPTLIQNTESNIINKMYCYKCTENSDLTTYTVSTFGTTNHEDERDITNCPNGYSSEAISKCAKAGNGYARITYLGN